MRELHDWVAARSETNPASADRVCKSCVGITNYWHTRVNLTPEGVLAASLAAMEIQRIVEIHNEGRNPDLLAA